MIRELSNTEIIAMMGQRLKQYRLNLSITQKEMALNTGVSLPTIQRLEAGSATNVTLSTVLTLMRYLGIIENADQLIPLQPESPYAIKPRQRIRHGKD
jgi:Predicted transcriptional regulator with C-terminal CBS domains